MIYIFSALLLLQSSSVFAQDSAITLAEKTSSELHLKYKNFEYSGDEVGDYTLACKMNLHFSKNSSEEIESYFYSFNLAKEFWGVEILEIDLSQKNIFHLRAVPEPRQKINEQDQDGFYLTRMSDGQRILSYNFIDSKKESKDFFNIVPTQVMSGALLSVRISGFQIMNGHPGAFPMNEGVTNSFFDLSVSLFKDRKDFYNEDVQLFSQSLNSNNVIHKDQERYHSFLLSFSTDQVIVLDESQVTLSLHCM